jgi:tight adherence protein B
MNELQIIYVLVFAAALLGVQGLYWVLVKARRDTTAINRRLSLHDRIADPSEVLQALRRERAIDFFAYVPSSQKLQQLMMQSGLRLNDPKLALMLGGVCVVLYLLLRYFFTGSHLIAIGGAIVLSVVGAYLYLRSARKRRIAAFSEQLPDALDVIVRGLRAGHPFRVAMALVSREMPDPIGSEFGIAADEITYGLEQSNAIVNLCKRVGQDDLAFFSTAISVQQQSGGNLAEILGRLSRLIRSRTMMKLKIRALSAEGRMSGVLLSAAPFVLMGIIQLIAPNYFAATNDSPLMLPAIIFGAVLLIAGNITMYRMVNFRF